MDERDVVAIINELALSGRAELYTGSYEQGYLHALEDLMVVFDENCEASAFSFAPSNNVNEV